MSSVYQVWPNHLARHSESGRKTRQAEEEVGRQHQGMDRTGVRQVPEGGGEQGKTEKTGCEIFFGAPMILAVKGLMMMMMMMMRKRQWSTIYKVRPKGPKLILHIGTVANAKLESIWTLCGTFPNTSTIS